MNLFQSLIWRVNSFIGTLQWTPTSNVTITLPPRTGTVTLDDDITNSGRSRSFPHLISVSASKTLALTDGGTCQSCRAGAAITVTIPPDASVSFPIGTEIRFSRGSTTSVSLQVGSGVSLTSNTGASTSPFSIATWAQIRKIAINGWTLEIPTAVPGDLPASTTATTQVAATNNTTLATTAFATTAITNSVRPAIEAIGVTTVVSGGYTQLTYSAAQLDTNTMLNAATGLIRIAVGQGGMYEYSSFATISDPGNNIQIKAFKNGALVVNSGSPGLVLPSDTFFFTSTTQKIRLTAGDTFAIRFYLTQVATVTGIQCSHSLVFMRVY